MSTIGKRIRDRRTQLGLTQKEIGDALNRSAGAVTQWETDMTKPNGQNLVKLSKVLNCDPEWLITGLGELEGAEFINWPSYARSRMGIPVPVITWDDVSYDSIDMSRSRESIITTSTVSNFSFALRVKNDFQISTPSLKLPPNSLLIIDEEKDDLSLLIGKMVLIHSKQAPEATVKILMFDGERYQLLPTMPHLSIIPLDSKVKIIGSIRQVIIDF